MAVSVLPAPERQLNSESLAVLELWSQHLEGDVEEYLVETGCSPEDILLKMNVMEFHLSASTFGFSRLVSIHAAGQVEQTQVAFDIEKRLEQRDTRAGSGSMAGSLGDQRIGNTIR